MIYMRSFVCLGLALGVQACIPAMAQPVQDTESPMAELPGIGVDWPDMTALPAQPGESTETQSIAIDAGMRRYSVKIDGLPPKDSDQILSQFDTLSTLRAGESKAANTAQIERRMREDTDLLNTLLRASGYYDGDADADISANVADTGLQVTFTVDPGPAYHLKSVDVQGLDGAGSMSGELGAAFGISPADQLDSADILAGTETLKLQIGRAGFPFAKIGEPEVVVDHDTQTASLILKVDPGGQQHFGAIKITNPNAPFNARHAALIARFKPGQLYDQNGVDDLQRAIIATGLVSSVKLEPIPTTVPGIVDIAATLEPAPVHTLAGEAGYGTGEGARVEVSWTHRNLIRPEGAVTLRGVLGTKEQQLGALLRQNNFARRDQVLNARAAFSNINRLAYAARTLEIGAGIERQTNIIWQKKWTWSAGVELLTSDERDTRGALARRRTYFIGALPLSLAYDGSDDLFDPHRGFRLSGRISPEVSFQSGTFGYARIQVDASAYIPAGSRIVIAGRGRLGTIAGAPRDAIAPSRRFYAGGGGSVRGFDYQGLGPRDAFNDPTGGRSLAEFSLEARVRVGSFGIVPFFDGGKVDSRIIPDLKGFRFGAGIGARYYTSFGPIRIDLATPLQRRAGEPRVGVYVSLGQAF
jgi:translocation and assembly module TamA